LRPLGKRPLGKVVARKMRGSHNRRQAIGCLRKHRARVASLPPRPAAQADDGEIVRRAASIGVEDIAAVLKEESTSRAIAEFGFYEFRRQLDYKAAEAGVEITVAEGPYPSSRLSSACGEGNQVSRSNGAAFAAGRARAAEPNTTAT
jgi:putative transposase